MLFSIIIATYNAEKTLNRCLDSILLQSFKDCEVIVVDGASIDNTVGIVSTHPSVTRYISENDNGIYDAWNKGIKLSSGQWVLFLGSDDYLTEGALEALALVCIQNPLLDYISGKMLLVDVSGNYLREVGEPWVWSAFRHTMNVAHPCSAHHIRLFDEVGLYDTTFKITGDYELLLRKGRSLKTSHFDTVLCCFSVGGVSYLNKHALLERYRAKRITASESIVRNFASLCWSLIKMAIKKSLMRFKLIKV